MVAPTQWTHGLDAPVKVLLQKRNNVGGLEAANHVLAETITESSGQGDRSSNELVPLGMVTAVFATSDIYGELQNVREGAGRMYQYRLQILRAFQRG
jgi:hypothetical protein